MDGCSFLVPFSSLSLELRITLVCPWSVKKISIRDHDVIMDWSVLDPKDLCPSFGIASTAAESWRRDNNLDSTRRKTQEARRKTTESSLSLSFQQEQQPRILDSFVMSILEYNGAAMIAMVGKDCVGIAADRRLGQQLTTIATDFTKVFQMSKSSDDTSTNPQSHSIFIGLAGLATDVQTVHQLLEFRMNLYQLQEDGRTMSPSVFSHLVSNILYEKRFGPYFVEPIIAGMTHDKKSGQVKPYLAAMDLIGASVEESTFVVSGTCTGNMYGMCESLYQPNMDEQQLFETLAQCLLSSVDRDAMSGWGGVVHIVSKDGTVTSKELKGRQD